MKTIEKVIEETGIIPVVVIHDEKHALPLAKALCGGGLPCAEITFRTQAAMESIRQISQAYPDMLLGAGTILTTQQVDEAVEAGAAFIVSPGFDSEIVDYCISKNIPVIPGCITPSEIAQAAKRGLTHIKFFPAQQAGGAAAIKAMGAAYPFMRFMPTGGISPENLRDYLSCSNIYACGGSWMVKSSLLEAGNFQKITELTAQAVSLVKSIRGGN